MALAKRKLGRTGLNVTVMGFGGAPLGDLFAKLDDATALATVDAAAHAGITHFDAAPLYGQGIAEHRFGTILRRLPRDSFTLSTKVGRLLVPAPNGRNKSTRYVGGLEFDVVHDYGYDATMRSLEHSLLRFGLARIDFALIHDADAWSHGPEKGEQYYRDAMSGAYKALDKLRSEGVLKGIGIGLNDPAFAARYLREGDFDCMLMAGRYSLLEQPALAEVLPLAQKKQVGVMLGGVFNSGILATGAMPNAKYNYVDAPPAIMDKVRKIEKVTEAHGIALPTAAMHFCLGHPAVATLVLGAVKPDEVRRNVAALSQKVPAALWADLKSEGLLDKAAPTPT